MSVSKEQTSNKFDGNTQGLDKSRNPAPAQKTTKTAGARLLLFKRGIGIRD